MSGDWSMHTLDGPPGTGFQFQIGYRADPAECQVIFEGTTYGPQPLSAQGCTIYGPTEENQLFKVSFDFFNAGTLEVGYIVFHYLEEPKHYPFPP